MYIFGNSVNIFKIYNIKSTGYPLHRLQGSAVGIDDSLQDDKHDVNMVTGRCISRYRTFLKA